MPSPKVIALNPLVPEKYDYISITYSGSNISRVIYKTGGASGTTVAILNLAYTGSNLTSVTRDVV